MSTLSVIGQVNQIKQAVQSLPHSDSRFQAMMSANQNVADTVREGSIEAGTKDAAELWLSSYYAALDVNE